MVVALVAVTAACGGDDGGADAVQQSPGDSPTTVTVPTTTTEPLPFPAALQARLAEELGDPAMARGVIESVGPDVVQQLRSAVGDEVATHPLLTYRPEAVDPDGVDSLVVFAFGNRVGGDGTVTPGPVNGELATATAAFVAEHEVPVYAQWEVADELAADGVGGVTPIEPDVGPDGEVVYLSTAGVAEKAVTLATDAGDELGTVGVLCFADHIGRCLLTAEAAGMEAVLPDGVELPATYDPDSGQEWTRDRLSYLVTDLTGRILTLEG